MPRLYVPIYILIRVPLMTLFGAALAMMFAAVAARAAGSRQQQRSDIALVSLTVIFPLACQVIVSRTRLHRLAPFSVRDSGAGDARRHRSRRGVDGARDARPRGRLRRVRGRDACFLWDAVTLVRLHPYEYLFYNALVGGLEGASRRYDLDYWFSSMPEALNQLEAYLRRTDARRCEPADADLFGRGLRRTPARSRRPSRFRNCTGTSSREWEQSEFFIAPTHMNCDGDLDGKVIGTVERLGVVIAYVKDRRALTRPVTANAASVLVPPR